jgi:hypothetical protein
VAGQAFVMIAGRFVAEQTRKTLQRPSRLFYGPARLLRLAVSRLIFMNFDPLFRLHQVCIRFLSRATPQNALLRFVARKLLWLVDRTLKGVPGSYFFHRGTVALQENRPLVAWEYFYLGLDNTDDYKYLRTAGATLYVGLGRMREALTLQRRADDLRLASAARLGIIPSDLLVLDYFWYAHIGHAAQIDYIVKLAQLDIPLQARTRRIAAASYDQSPTSLMS